MTQRYIEKLVEDLEKQGCRVRRTTGGYFLYCPDGKTTIGFHSSNYSDRRSMANIKAAVRRANLRWPESIPA